MVDVRAHREAFRFQAGSAATITVTAANADGDPVDLTSHTLTLTPNGETPIAATTADPEAGTRVFSFDADDTALLDDAGKGSISLADGDGDEWIVGSAWASTVGTTSQDHEVSVVLGSANIAVTVAAYIGAGGGGGTGLPDGGTDGQVPFMDGTEVGWLSPNSPNGYARLDGDGTVPDNRIPSTIARDSEVTAAITAAIPPTFQYVGLATPATLGEAADFITGTTFEWETPFPLPGGVHQVLIVGTSNDKDGAYTSTGEVSPGVMGFEFSAVQPIAMQYRGRLLGVAWDTTRGGRAATYMVAVEDGTTSRLVRVAQEEKLRAITVPSDNVTVTEITASNGLLDYDIAEVEPSTGERGKIALPPLDEWPNQTFTVVPLPKTATLTATQGPSIGYPVPAWVAEPTPATGSGSVAGEPFGPYDGSSDTNLAGGVTLVPPAITGPVGHVWTPGSDVPAGKRVTGVTVQGAAVDVGSGADILIGVNVTNGGVLNNIAGHATGWGAGGDDTTTVYDGSPGTTDLEFTFAEPINAEDLTGVAVLVYIFPTGGAPVGPDSITFSGIVWNAEGEDGIVYQGYDTANPDLGVGEMNDPGAGLTHAYPDDPSNPDRSLTVYNTGSALVPLQVANRWEFTVGVTPEIGGPADTATNLAQAVAMLNQAAVDLESSSAATVEYDNTTSGLTAETVQDAVDELASSPGGSGPDLSDADPEPDGTASPGVSDEAARADHVHPASVVGFQRRLPPESRLSSGVFGAPLFPLAPNTAPATYALAAGEMVVAAGDIVGEPTLHTLRFNVTASSLSAGQSITVVVYDLDDDGLPTGSPVVSSSQVVGTTTGAYAVDVSASSIELPAPPYAVGVLNPSGNAGSVTLAAQCPLLPLSSNAVGDSRRHALNQTGLATPPDVTGWLIRSAPLASNWGFLQNCPVIQATST